MRLAAEPVAGAAEAADDLVADQQDAVLVADALDLGPVGGGRDDHAAGALHRLADEGRHLVGADSRILASSQRAAIEAEFVAATCPGRARTSTAARCARCRGSAARPARACRHAAQRGAGHRRAVVGVVAADDHLALAAGRACPSSGAPCAPRCRCPRSPSRRRTRAGTAAASPRPAARPARWPAAWRSGRRRCRRAALASAASRRRPARCWP